MLPSITATTIRSTPKGRSLSTGNLVRPQRHRRHREFLYEKADQRLRGLCFRRLRQLRYGQLRRGGHCPQGTLYGRNAIGGIVNFYTKKPTNAYEGYASVDYGNYDTVNSEGAVNVP